MFAQVVLPDDQLWQVVEARQLLRGSLVEVLGTRPECVEVRVLSVPPLYPLEHAALPGEQLCVAGELLGVPSEFRTETGFKLWLGERPLPGWSTLDLGEKEGLIQVQQEFSRLFGPIHISELQASGAGLVGLPLWERAPEVLKAERETEKLKSRAQVERQLTHTGPFLEGIPLYTHFTGSDLPLSDIWAEPEAIVQLLKLSASWNQQCRGCGLAIGDLSWFSRLKIDGLDPLGHKEHFLARCADIRLWRTDDSPYEAWWNKKDDRPEAIGGYNRATTRRFVDLAVDRFFARGFFNDPELRRPEIKPLKGHDDHLHLCF
jgi:hypothetical protein